MSDATPAAVEVGNPAPDFTLPNQHGEDVTLSSFHGHGPVVVMFYPFAFSGICSSELAELRDRRGELGGAQVLAISCDPMFALRALDDRERYGICLLSDFWPHGMVASAYGVFDGERGCAVRGTYVVDTDGLVQWKVENGLGEARELDSYVAALDRLHASRPSA